MTKPITYIIKFKVNKEIYNKIKLTKHHAFMRSRPTLHERLTCPVINT